jgi:hypothetical protein
MKPIYYCFALIALLQSCKKEYPKGHGGGLIPINAMNMPAPGVSLDTVDGVIFLRRDKSYDQYTLKPLATERIYLYIKGGGNLPTKLGDVRLGEKQLRIIDPGFYNYTYYWVKTDSVYSNDLDASVNCVVKDTLDNIVLSVNLNPAAAIYKRLFTCNENAQFSVYIPSGYFNYCRSRFCIF